MKSRIALIASFAALLAALACLAVWPTFQDPVTWTPDGLYYQVQLLEFRGVDHDAAFDADVRGPALGRAAREGPAPHRQRSWAEYNEPFYERRLALPLGRRRPLRGRRRSLAAATSRSRATSRRCSRSSGSCCCASGSPSRAAVDAAGRASAAAHDHSSYPLTDSWGLALEIVAFAAAILAFDRGLRWLPLWIGAIACSGSRATAPGSRSWRSAGARSGYRSRVPRDARSRRGVLAALPALLLFKTPVRELLALLVNDPSRGGHVVGVHPRRLPEALARARAGQRRVPPTRRVVHGGLYLVGGVLALLLFVWRAPRDPERSRPR